MTIQYSEHTSSVSFQFSARDMELLRKGDVEAANEVIRETIRYFDGFSRAIRSRVGGWVSREFCEDAVFTFFEEKLLKLVDRYRDCSPGEFTGKFYTALKNHAIDMAREIGRYVTSTDLQTGDEDDGRGGYFDRLPSEREVAEDRLRADELAALEEDVRRFIVSWTDDPLQQWVLETAIFGEKGAAEISSLAANKFGKAYATGSVYSVLSRFRKAPGLRRIKDRYFPPGR